MRYVYLGGPYYSRRLGVSLGINVLDTVKKCTFDCVYCEIGKTRPQNLIAIDQKIIIDPDYDSFRKELTTQLKENPGIDSITFGYYGETTLCPFLIDYAKLTKTILMEIFGESRKAMLTIFSNSSTILSESTRTELKYFDQIVLKLDCIEQDDFLQLNRPHGSVPSIEKIISAIEIFQRELDLIPEPGRPKIILQTLLLTFNNGKDIIRNHSEEKFKHYCRIINQIKPFAAHIYTLSRSPAYAGATPLKLEEKKILEKIGKEYINETIIWRIF